MTVDPYPTLGDEPILQLRSPQGAAVTIHRQGAHITHWQTASGHPWLFTSRQAQYAPGVAIRGGVPIIFPQFNAFGFGPRHGFARTVDWQLSRAPRQRDDGCECEFELTDSPATQAVWPHRFRAEFGVRLSEQALTMTLRVRNTGTQPLKFTAALHSYFAVSHIRHVQILGLQGLNYWDNDGSPFTQRQTFTPQVWMPQGAIDRVFFDCSRPLQLIDGSHCLQLEHTGFADVVVWNPGAEGAQALTDMADDEHPYMLCIEAAAIDRPIELPAGEQWCGQQKLVSA